MKKFLKYTVLLLQIVMVGQLSSCKKDDPGKKDCCSQKGRVVYLPVGCVGNSTVLGILDENGNYLYVKSDLTKEFLKYKENDEICFDYKETSPCNIVLPMGIMKTPLRCVSLTCLGHCGKKQVDCYTVEYIPSQCASTHSAVLGLKSSEGKFFMVRDDRSGLFAKFKRGDKVRVELIRVKDCAVCMACHCPSPDACIDIVSIDFCDLNTRCKLPKELDYYLYRSFNEQQYHTIRNARVINGMFKFDVAVSGCDASFNPELYLTRPPLGAPISVLKTKLKFNRSPQTCKAIFTKELCFDIKPWLNQKHKSISIEYGNENLSVPL